MCRFRIARSRARHPLRSLLNHFLGMKPSASSTASITATATTQQLQQQQIQAALLVFFCSDSCLGTIQTVFLLAESLSADRSTIGFQMFVVQGRHSKLLPVMVTVRLRPCKLTVLCSRLRFDAACVLRSSVCLAMCVNRIARARNIRDFSCQISQVLSTCARARAPLFTNAQQVLRNQSLQNKKSKLRHAHANKRTRKQIGQSETRR